MQVLMVTVSKMLSLSGTLMAGALEAVLWLARTAGRHQQELDSINLKQDIARITSGVTGGTAKSRSGNMRVDTLVNSLKRGGIPALLRIDGS